MADDKEQTDNEKGEVKPSFFATHKKLLLLGLLGLLLVGVSVGGTLVAIGMLADDEPIAAAEALEGEAGAEAAVSAPIKKAIYYPLKPALMVSFDARGRQRLMQAEITLLTREPDVIAAVESHMPMVRNALVLLMSGQSYEEMQTAEGKELLRVQCVQELQRLMQKEIGKPGIEEVLFTSIIVQ